MPYQPKDRPAFAVAHMLVVEEVENPPNQISLTTRGAPIPARRSATPSRTLPPLEYGRIARSRPSR